MQAVAPEIVAENGTVVNRQTCGRQVIAAPGVSPEAVGPYAVDKALLKTPTASARG